MRKLRKHVTIAFDQQQIDVKHAKATATTKVDNDNDDEIDNNNNNNNTSTQTATTATTTTATATTQSNKSIQWQQMWKDIEDMRAATPAAVDTMGCESFYDVDVVRRRFPNEAQPEKIARYRILVSLMLSSQTKDTETYKAMQRLTEHGLTVEAILAIDDKRLDELIANVGFHNKKVQYLKRTAAILKEKYGGDVPNTFDELIALPGVGPKMAHLTLQHAHNITLGVSVDTHVHRISARLGWTRNAKTPLDTAKVKLTLLSFSFLRSIDRVCWFFF